MPGHLYTTIIPEKQSFSPGLLHKNATIRGNPALIRPFPPKTPGLLHRPPCPLTRGRGVAEQHSADTQHVKRQALPLKRGSAYRPSRWHSRSYASAQKPKQHTAKHKKAAPLPMLPKYSQPKISLLNKYWLKSRCICTEILACFIRPW